MDLLDDFDRVRATFSELGAIGQRIDSSLADDGGVSSLNVASTSYDLPGLSVEASVRQAARCDSGALQWHVKCPLFWGMIASTCLKACR